MQSITEKVSRNNIVYFVFKTSLNFFFLIIRILIKPLSENSENVAIVALHKLGDSVFTIPAIWEIHKRLRNKKITILCYPEVVSIYAQALTDVNFSELEHKHFYLNGRYANSKARKKLKVIKPEIIFDLTGVMTSATLIFMSRAKEIIGFNREHFKSIYTHYCPKTEIPHLSKMYLSVIKPYFNILDDVSSCDFPIQNNLSGRILIQPFAGWKAKEWNFNKFVDLGKQLSETYKIEFVIPGNMKNSSKAIAIRDEGFNIIETSTTDELISKLKEASLLISNDSGPIYIAGLLGIPTFTIFGPTNPLFHNLGGKYHKFIQKKIHCSPLENEKQCFTKGGRVGCPSFECMHQLSLNEVTNKIEQFISELKINGSLK